MNEPRSVLSHQVIALPMLTLLVMALGLAGCGGGERARAGSMRSIRVEEIAHESTQLQIHAAAIARIVIVAMDGSEKSLTCGASDDHLQFAITEPELPCAFGVRVVTADDAHRYGLPEDLLGTSLVFFGHETSAAVHLEHGGFVQLTGDRLRAFLHLYGGH